MTRGKWVALGSLLIVLMLASSGSAATMYYLTDLGDLPFGIDGSSAYGINDYGQVTGISGAGLGGIHGFLWTPDAPNGIEGSMIDLGSLTGNGVSFGQALNSYGQVAGYSAVPGGLHATLWTPAAAHGTSGSWTDLGKMPGASDESYGYGINDLGQVTGSSAVSTDATQHSIIWTPSAPNGTSGSMTVINAGANTGGSNINNYGQVVGGNLWTPSTPNGTVGSFTSISGSAGVIGASDINSTGQIAGVSVVGGKYRAFRWTPSSPNGSTGSGIDLGIFPGGREGSVALGINDPGDVVGFASGAQIFRHAFVWTANEGLVDLNTRVYEGNAPELTEARAINRFGQIVGIMAEAGGRAFLLTPVSLPEPSGFALMAVGAAVAAARRRSKRHRTR